MGFEVVVDRIGVHGEKALTQIRLVFVGDVDEGESAVEILLKDAHVVRVVLGCKTIGLFEQIGGDVIARIEAVARVNLAVDACGHGFEHFLVGQSAIVVDPRVGTGGETIMHAPFLAHDAGSHVVEIVLLRLLVGGIVALELEFFGFQVVAGIVLVGDGERHKVHVAEVLPSAAVAAERHHAQHRGLGVVARVFGAAFALGDPDVVVFAGDHPVHVTTHVATGFQQFAFTDGAPHDECFVHAHEAFDPGVDEQIIADGDLYRVGESRFDEAHIEKSGVEYDVAVVGNKGVACRVRGDGTVVEGELARGVCNEDLHHAVHVALLKTQSAVHSQARQAQKTADDGRGEGHKTAKYAHEKAITKQDFELFAHFMVGIGANVVKLGGDLSHGERV